MIVNNVFVTGYSLDIIGTSLYSDFDGALDKLDDFICETPTYNNIEVCSDFLTYKFGVETLQDLLYEIAEYSDPLYTEMLKELNHVIKDNKAGTDTEVALSSSGLGLAWKGGFIGYYSQGKTIPTVDVKLIIDDSSALAELNYRNLEDFPINEKSFSDRSKLIFNNITFHKDFSSTLSTVKSGDFKLYSVEFTRAMKTLHNAFPKLTNKGHNPPDLITIRDESHKAGRTMGCTVQGKNKKYLCDKDFEVDTLDGSTHKISNLNCEFHLKVNYDNSGKKLAGKFYNRAYFGLPLIKGKKYIALLHLGKHYD